MENKQRKHTVEALAWAYQLCGARWPNEHALDNLSAVQRGEEPPHEWPVVPPVESAREVVIYVRRRKITRGGVLVDGWQAGFRPKAGGTTSISRSDAIEDMKGVAKRSGAAVINVVFEGAAVSRESSTVKVRAS